MVDHLDEGRLGAVARPDAQHDGQCLNAHT
jgi:hypothetical protein